MKEAGSRIDVADIEEVLGAEVKVDVRPDWHVKQNGERHPNPMVYGAEIKYL